MEEELRQGRKWAAFREENLNGVDDEAEALFTNSFDCSRALEAAIKSSTELLSSKLNFWSGKKHV